MSPDDKQALRASWELYAQHRDRVLQLLLDSSPPLSAERAALVARGTQLLFEIGADTPGQTQDRQFRAMFENNVVPLWMHDPSSQRFTAVNDALLRMYGYSRAEMLDMATTAIDLGDAEGTASRPTATLRRHRRKDGSTLVVEMTSNALPVGDHLLHMVSIADVSERELTRQALHASEQQLQHSQKMDALGQLASGVAHDFNNIIAIVLASACMLEESLEANDPRQFDAVQIRLASERATKLTQQLLTLSRKSAAAPRPIVLDELVAAFSPSLRRLLGRGVVLEIQSGQVPPVVVDPGQIEQVVMNLAVNARDAMDGKGRLNIETSIVDLDLDGGAMHGLAPGRYVVLAVSDSGPGISPEIQKRIFEPFFTTKEAGKGTGLGLSIAHGIVTQAGGAIDVYSERGHGTTFRIRLPTSTDTIVVQVDAVTASPRPLTPVTVLYVDHESDLRNVVARLLQTNGCTVLAASTAMDARDICVTHDGVIDIAVLDVALSDGRGDLLIRELRELRPNLKFLLVSGFPTAAIGPSGEMPAQVLAKPFTPAQLRDAIAAITSDQPPVRVSEPNLQSRVLLADDDPALRRMLTRLLKRGGFDVVDVDSGRDAFAELSKRRFDVILSDIHMPGGDGLELLRSVRRLDLDVPVILMSGKPDVQTAATALEFGAFRYLSKPLESEAIEKVVRHAARAHALARIRREAMILGSGSHVGTADRAGLEVRFEHALDKLWMAFQPIVDAKTGHLFGVEALMRSREPSIPSPPALLDAATQLGRLPLLGRHIRELSANALAARGDIPSLFVNLHPSDLVDINLVDPAAPLTQIASRVVLEVTERESLDNSPALAARLERLRDLGFRIAVDDIGAGYSGLTSFTDLMPEIVKIDMSLVRAIDTSTVKQRTVSALCRLCHEMGTLVVGEGVETTDEQACLVELGCDLLQGFLIARPSAELPPP